ncbi:MAG: hypothetical protein ACOCNB_02470, partial [Acetivibrio ethanolgignens]
SPGISDVPSISEVPSVSPGISDVPSISEVPSVSPEIPALPVPGVQETFPELESKDFNLPSAVINKFPFCIPFDLINAVRVLQAPGKAPVFKIPFQFKRLNIDETVVIDMGQFEELAKICRYFFTLLFILGLVLLTRGLIKG